MELRKAAGILERIRRRDLYLMVDSPITLEGVAKRKSEIDIEQEIRKQGLPVSLVQDAPNWQNDLVVIVTYIDFGAKDEHRGAFNPLEKVTFFNPKRQETLDKGFKINQDKYLSKLYIPMSWSEVSVYVYTRNRESFKAVKTAYKK